MVEKFWLRKPAQDLAATVTKLSALAISKMKKIIAIKPLTKSLTREFIMGLHNSEFDDFEFDNY